MEVIILIQPQVINLAQTVIYYNMSIAAEGATKYIALNGDTIGELQQIRLAPETGRVIALVEQANNYLKMIGPASCTKSEFNDRIPDDGCYPSNCPTQWNPTGCPPVYQTGGAATGNSVLASVDNTEVKHLEFSTALNVTFPSAARTWTRRIPLSLFKGTIFAHDKDIYFPQAMTLTLTFSCAKAAFSVVSNVNPALGAAALAGAGMTFTNMSLLLPVESNLEIAKNVKDYFTKPGASIPIESLKYFKTNQSGAQHNPCLFLTSADGSALKQIIPSPFANAETANFALDNSNFIDGSATTLATFGGKVLSYRTMLDSEPLQKNDIQCCPANPTAAANYTQYPSGDYAHNKKFMLGSAMTNKEQYRLNWFHHEDFMGLPDKLSGGDKMGAYDVGGIAMDKSRKYEVVAQVTCDSGGTALTLNWYMYAVFARTLVFGASSIDVF